MTSTTPEGFDSEATGTYVIPLSQRVHNQGQNFTPVIEPTDNLLNLSHESMETLRNFSVDGGHGLTLRCDMCAEIGVAWRLDWPAHVAAPLMNHFAVQVQNHWNEVHA